MEFSAFFDQFITLDDLRRDNVEDLLSAYKSHCEFEDDFIQLYELKSILEVANLFHELYAAFQSCSEDYQPLFDNIEALSEKLEDAGISCYSYAYYISVFLNYIFEKDTRFARSNTLDPIKWNNPKYFSYGKTLYEKTFGMVGNSRTKAYPDDKKFHVTDGKLISYSGIKPYVIIPDYVKAISASAFAGKRIKMIYLPDSVETIEEGAFANCTKLDFVHLGSGIRSVPKKCFERCKNLKYVIGENIDSVGDSAFHLCIQLRGINFGHLKSAGNHSFEGCVSLLNSELDFISDLDFIGVSAFQGCKIKELFLNDCSNLGSFAFFSCTDLTKIVINKPIGSMGRTPLLGCLNTKEVDLNFAPNFKILDLFEPDSKSFQEKEYKLEKVQLPILTSGICSGLATLLAVNVKGKTGIPPHAFENCVRLKSVVFQNDEISEIGEYAFANCQNLDELNIRYKGETLEESAFYKCGSIKNFDFLKSVTIFKKKCLAYTNLTSFDFFKNREFKYIGAFAFANSYFPDLLNLKLDGTRISLGAFHGVKQINTVLAHNINLTGDEFYLVFEKTLEQFNEKVVIRRILSDFVASESLFENINSEYIECKVQDGIVPARLFCGCHNLKTAKINGIIKELDDSCFENCTNLQLVDGMFGEEIYVRNKAFKNCSKYEYALFENTRFVGDYAFYGSSLKKLHLPESIQHIGKNAFGNCPIAGPIVLPFTGTDLNSDSPFGVIFSDNPVEHSAVQSISEGENYYISAGVKEVEVLANRIGDNSFKNCYFLESITLDNVEMLTEPCFFNCSSLKRLALGESLQIFDSSALIGTQPSLELRIVNNRRFCVRKNSVYSNDGEILYYANPMQPLDLSGVRAIKAHAIPSYGGSEISLANVDLIEKEAVNLSSVKSIDIVDVNDIEDGAFIHCSNIEHVSISSALHNRYGNIFAGYQGKSIKQLVLNNVDIPTISSFFGNPEKVSLEELRMRDSRVEEGFFDRASLSRIIMTGVQGSASLRTPASRVCLEKCAPFSQLLGNGVTSDFVYISTKDLNPGDIGNLNAETLQIEATGAIKNRALDGIQVNGYLIIDGVKFIENEALKQAHFNKIEIKNSQYKSEDNCIFINGSLFYLKPGKKKVRIPKDIENIGEYSVDLNGTETLLIENNGIVVAKKAFYNCSELKYVICSFIQCEKLLDLFENADSIESIDYRDDVVPNKYLSGFKGLKSILLPKSIQRLSDFCFAHNPNLMSIQNFANAVYYGDFILDGCSSLTRVIFNPNAKFIGFKCLNGCQRVTDVSLPVPANHMSGASPFAEAICSNEGINVGVTRGDIPPHYFQGSSDHITLVYSPENVGEGAFADCSYLNVDFAKTKFIGARAFRNSGVLKCNLASCLNVGDEAFEDCSNIHDLILSAELESIGEKAFFGAEISTIKMKGEGKTYRVCDNAIIQEDNLAYYAPFAKAKTFDSSGLGIKKIMPFAFSHCKYLDTFIGTGATEFCHDSFVGCSALSNVEIPEPDCLVASGTFVDCDAISRLTIEKIHTEENANLSKLFLIHGKNQVPGSLSSLLITGNKLSAEDLLCENKITSISLNNEVKEIPDGYFSSCRELKSFSAPSKCEKVGREAFKDCAKLTSYVDQSVSEYGDRCFENSGILTFRIKNGAKKVGAEILKDCNHLTSLAVEGNLDGFSLSEFGLSPSESCLEKVEIENAESLSPSAFEGFATLADVALSDRLSEIPAKCFKDCKNLKTLRLPEKCSSIGLSAFEGSGIVEITVSLSLTSIKENAFGNSKLQKIDTSSLQDIGAHAFFSTPLTDVVLTDALSSLGEKPFEGCPITSVKYSVKGISLSLEKLGISRGTLKSVEISNCEKLEPNAFKSCSQLQKAVVEGERSFPVPAGCFEGCSSLSTIIFLPKPSAIGEKAFAGCKKLQPARDVFALANSIGSDSFASCESIGQLNISNATLIGPRAFSECALLSSVDLNANLENIPEECFKGTSLSDVVLPEALKSIGDRAFERTKIRQITFPRGIKEVGSMVFKDNKKKIKVTILGNQLGWASDWNQGLAHKHRWGIFNPKVKVILKKEA